MQKIILTISLLVSNRIDTIRKCMESIRPLLEQLPSELIVIDTKGSETDGSIEIVREYTNQIYFFSWCNDFSAARNEGLKRAKGEWFLFMDDDEWFDDVTEIITFFQSGEYKNYRSATYKIRNYTTKTGDSYHTAILARMVRLDKDTCFIGSIHETFSKMELPCKDFSAFVHHFGYAYADEEEKIAHLKRNIPLLEKELEKNPTDLRYRAQMAMELANFDNTGALEFCEKTFELCAKENKDVNFQWQLSLVFCLYEALGTEVEIAEQRYAQLKQQFDFLETTENAISYQMVRICLLNNIPEKAYLYATKYFETLQFLLENREVQQKQMTADSYRYQTEEAYYEMLHFGAYSAWKSKEYQQAWNWYQQLPWEQETFENEEAFQLMLGLFQEYPNARCLVEIIKRIMRNNSFMQKDNVRAGISNVLAILKA